MYHLIALWHEISAINTINRLKGAINTAVNCNFLRLFMVMMNTKQHALLTQDEVGGSKSFCSLLILSVVPEV